MALHPSTIFKNTLQNKNPSYNSKVIKDSFFVDCSAHLRTGGKRKA